MSRIGKKEIVIPADVTVTINGTDVSVKGPKGEITIPVHPVIGDAVEGVHAGFKKQLELQGVGYRASMQGKNIQLLVGFSHPVLIEAPEGISFTVEKEIITVEGFDAYQVGQIAANIRKVRPPEPYKGKGIRYVGEHVRRKVGKIVGSAA